jgi:hypothetical protein
MKLNIFFYYLAIPNSSKILLPIDNLHVEHHQKSRLGHGETFDIIAAPKPGSLAPLRNVPRFLAAEKKPPTIDPDLQAKLLAKQERASRKRQVRKSNSRFIIRSDFSSKGN